MIDQIWGNQNDNNVMGTPDYWLVFTGIPGIPGNAIVPAYF